MTGGTWVARSARRSGTLLLMSLLLGAAPAMARSVAEIVQSGVLRLCVAGSSADFYQTNGEAFARFLNVRPEVTRLEAWDQQFHNDANVVDKDGRYVAKLLANGRCDVFPNDLHVLDWRASKMDLVPYYTTRKVVVGQRGLGSLSNVDALKGLHAAVQKGTAYESWLTEQNRSRFASQPVTVTLLPTQEAMAAVASKVADFTVIGAEASFKSVRADLDHLEILFPVDAAVPVAWGIHPRAEGLRERLEQFFKASSKVGSPLDESWRKQYGISLMEYQLFDTSLESSTLDFKRWLNWLVPLGVFLSLVLLAFVLWGRRLRAEIAARKAVELQSQDTSSTLAKEAQRNLQVSALLLELQRVNSYAGLSDTVFNSLAETLALGQASLYRADNEAQALLCCGAWAGASGNQTEARVAFGSGLLGQCALEKRTLLIPAPPQDYLTVRTGLASAPAKTLVLLPILSANTLMGVMELAAMQEFGATEQQLIERLLPTIALCMEVLQRSQHGKALLEETQRQAQELAAQKEATEATEAWYRSIIESAPDGMLVTDEQGLITLANPRLETMFGYAPGTLLGQPIEMLVPSDVRGTHAGLRAGYARSGTDRSMGTVQSELRGVRKDGSVFAVEVGLSRLPAMAARQSNVCATVRDITERRRVENEVQDAKQTLEIALTSAKMGTWKYYPAQARLDADAATVRLYGLEGVKLDGSMAQWFTYVEPQDAQRVGEVMQHTMAHQLAEYRAQFRVIKPDAQTVYIMSMGRFTYDAAGQAVLATGLVWDISEIKKSEAELEERMQELERLNRLTVDREERMIELKAEINALLQQAGLPPKYRIVE